MKRSYLLLTSRQNVLVTVGIWVQLKNTYTFFMSDKSMIEHIRFVFRLQDLTRASQLKYGDIPTLEKKIKDMEVMNVSNTKYQFTLKKEVTLEDVAKVVEQWTSVPVTKLVSKTF